MKIKLLLLISLVCSCNSIFEDQNANFKNVYKSVLDSREAVEDSQISKKITFSVRQISIRDFAVWFSDTYDIGFVYSENLVDKKLDLELKEADINEVVNSVARYLNVDALPLGNSYYVGEQKPSDNSVLVKKVRGVNIEDLRRLMSSITGKEGSSTASVTEDGIVFMIDKEQNLQPIIRALDTLEQDYKTAWVVQLYMFDLDTEKVRNLGIDISASGNIAYRFLKPNFDSLDGELQNVLLNGLIDFSQGSDHVSLVSNPLFVMRDGKSFNFSNLNQFPYVKKVTTQEGFVEEADVTFIDSGLDLKVDLREMIKGSMLSINLTNSKVLAIDPNSQLPIINAVTVQSEVPLHQSGIYLLCQSDYNEQRLESSWTHRNQTQNTSVLQIYAKVFKLDPKFTGLRGLQAQNFSE